jgi:hypothetical protein
MTTWLVPALRTGPEVGSGRSRVPLSHSFVRFLTVRRNHFIALVKTFLPRCCQPILPSAVFPLWINANRQKAELLGRVLQTITVHFADNTNPDPHKCGRRFQTVPTKAVFVPMEGEPMEFKL